MSERKKLVKKLDDVFQTYIRIRDNWTCIICGTQILFNKTRMHAGHYIDRGNLLLRWDERNVNAQCAKCNRTEGLTKDKNLYQNKISEKYGNVVLNELHSKKKEVYSISTSEIKEKIDYYKEKIKQI